MVLKVLLSGFISHISHIYTGRIGVKTEKKKGKMGNCNCK